MRLRATHPNHIWRYDFIYVRDAYGGKTRILNMIDEFSRKCLIIHFTGKIGSIQIIKYFTNAIIIHGNPEYIRSDNRPKFITKEPLSWLSSNGVKWPTLKQKAHLKIAFVKALTAPLGGTF